MKKLLLIAVLLFSFQGVFSQSHQKDDYLPIFTVKGVTHFVDVTSLEKLPDGTKVFWSMFAWKDNSLAFVSIEVNCSAYKLRIRETVFARGAEMFKSTKISPWLSGKNDLVTQLYMDFTCN